MASSTSNWRGEDLVASGIDLAVPLAEDELADLLERSSLVDVGDPQTIRDAAARPGPARDRARWTRSQLLTGRGFAIISGLPVDELDAGTSAVVFSVFGSMIGALRPQNAAGHRLGHVRDIGARADDPTARIYQTNERQSFHTDSADAVGLLCLHAAARGGESLLVSVAAVVEEMERRAPGVAARLEAQVETDRRGEVAEGERDARGRP